MAGKPRRPRMLTNEELAAKLHELGYGPDCPPPPLLVERLRQGLSRPQLLRMLILPEGVHVSEKSIERYEHGTSIPESQHVRLALADALGHSVEFFRFDATWKRPEPRVGTEVAVLPQLRPVLTEEELQAVLVEEGYGGKYPAPALLEERLRYGLSRHQLVMRLPEKVRVSTRAIEWYEHGIKIPQSAELRRALAAVFGRPVEYFDFDTRRKRPRSRGRGQGLDESVLAELAEQAAMRPVLTAEALQAELEKLGFGEGHPPTVLLTERLRLGYTQPELLEMLPEDVRFTVRQLRRYEAGTGAPKGARRAALAAALGRSAVFLFGEAPDEGDGVEEEQAPAQVWTDIDEYLEHGPDRSVLAAVAKRAAERPFLTEEQLQAELRRRGFGGKYPAPPLLEERLRQGLSLAELGELAKRVPQRRGSPAEAISAMSIGRFQFGELVPKIESQVALARALGLRVSHFQFGTKWERPPRSARPPAERAVARKVSAPKPKPVPQRTPRPSKKVTPAKATPTKTAAQPATEPRTEPPIGLRNLREHWRVPLVVVAALSGIPAEVLAAVEEGEELPDVGMLHALADVYGTAPEALWPCPEDNPLKARREELGLTRKKLADRVGADESLIWWLEAEHIPLQPWMLVPLSTALKCFPDDIRREADRSPLAAVLKDRDVSQERLVAETGLTRDDVRHLQAEWHYPRPGVLDRASALLGVEAGEFWRGPAVSPFRTERELLGLTTSQVAAQAQLPPAAVVALETQWRLPSTAVFMRMAFALGIDRDRQKELREKLVPELARSDGGRLWTYEDDVAIVVAAGLPNARLHSYQAVRAHRDPGLRPRHADRMAAPVLGYEAAHALGRDQARQSAALKVFPSDVGFYNGRPAKLGLPVEMTKLNRWFEEIRLASRSSDGEISTHEYTAAVAETVPARVGVRAGWYQELVHSARRQVQGLAMSAAGQSPWVTPQALPPAPAPAERQAPARSRTTKKAQQRPAKRAEPTPEQEQAAPQQQSPATPARPPARSQRRPAKPDVVVEPDALPPPSDREIRELLSDMGLGEPDELNLLMVERYKQELTVAAVAERSGVPEAAIHALEPKPLDPGDADTLRVARALGVGPKALGANPLRYQLTVLGDDAPAAARLAASLATTTSEEVARAARSRRGWIRRVPRAQPSRSAPAPHLGVTP